MILYILLFSVKASIERYKKACSDSSGAKSASESNVQVFIICSLQLHKHNEYLTVPTTKGKLYVK